MDPTNSLGMRRKRWILTGVFLLLTMIGAVIMVVKLPRTYQSDSSVVLLASQTVSKPNGDNPYLSFSPSLTLTADVVSRELMASSTAQQLAARGFPDSYAVVLATYATDTSGSVLLVTTTGTDKASVEHTLHGVTNEISVSLAELQAANTAKNRIRAVTLSMSKQATISVSHTARPMAVALGLGIALSVGIPWFADARTARRVIRRGAVPAKRGAVPAKSGDQAAGDQAAGDLVAGDLVADSRVAVPPRDTPAHVARSDEPLARAEGYERRPARR